MKGSLSASVLTPRVFWETIKISGVLRRRNGDAAFAVSLGLARRSVQAMRCLFLRLRLGKFRGEALKGSGLLNLSQVKISTAAFSGD